MDQDKIWELYQNDSALKLVGCKDHGRVAFIARHVPASASVLNIGVGVGTLERMLTASGNDIYSLDPSQTSINRLRTELHLGDKAKVGRAEEIPFAARSFDCVIMTEVLEHLTDETLARALDEVRRVLKPNGTFLGSVPADEDLADNLVVCPNCAERFHRWGHVQSFDMARLSSLLADKFHGANVKRVVFGDFSRLNWKGRISTCARMFQANILNRKGSNQNFYFEAYMSG